MCARTRARSVAEDCSLQVMECQLLRATPKGAIYTEILQDKARPNRPRTRKYHQRCYMAKCVTYNIQSLSQVMVGTVESGAGKV